MEGYFKKRFATLGEGIAEMMRLSFTAKSVFSELGSEDLIRVWGAENPVGSGCASSFEMVAVGYLYGRLQMGGVDLVVDRYAVRYTTSNGTLLAWDEDRDGKWQWLLVIRHKDGDNMSPDSSLRAELTTAGWRES